MIGTGSRKRAIGLLGGSFNPAHEGHRMISLIALKRLGLDEVWWLVSPQNPLKPVAGMAPFAERLASARAVAGHRRIKVSDIETRLGTHFTRDTLKRLAQRRRQHDFVWLMGADNLVQFPKWEGWQEIFNTVPLQFLTAPPILSRHWPVLPQPGLRGSAFRNGMPQDCREEGHHPGYFCIAG